MSAEVDRYRHTAAGYRSKAAELRATAEAEAHAMEEQAADLIALAERLDPLPSSWHGQPRWRDRR